MADRILPQDFYVYIHRRKSDGQVFYVGKGTGNRAWLAGRQRNRHWHNVANKHGWYVEIVQDGLQEWYAVEREVQLIALYGRKHLTNLTDGGDGLAGVKHSEETRRKISENQKGNKRGPETGRRIAAARAGYVTSEETRKKISASGKGRKPPEHCIERLREYWTGRKHSAESIEKMREAHAKRKPISDETRRKLSEAGKRRKQTPEAIAKTAAFHTGRKRSEEFRERMREIAKNRPKRSAESRAKTSLSLIEQWSKRRSKTPEQLSLF